MHPGAAEIHSAGTETAERGLTKFVYSRLIGLCLTLSQPGFVRAEIV